MYTEYINRSTNHSITQRVKPLACLHGLLIGDTYQIELESGMLAFEKGEKPENSLKNPRSRDENQQQPHMPVNPGNRTRAGIDGRRALSPLLPLYCNF